MARVGLAVPVLLAALGGVGCRAPATDDASSAPAAPIATAPEPDVPDMPTTEPDVPTTELTPTPEREPVAAPEPEPLAEPEPPPEPPPRLVETKCARRCEPLNTKTCVTRERPGAEPERLGCGEVSSSGRYAVIRRKRGRGDTTRLIYEYVTADGTTLHTDEGSCTEYMSVDCEDPGWFLGLRDEAWMHLMGNAGDGTNDQALWNIVSGQRYELPEGEHGLVVHPGGTLVGFLAMVPNDPAGGWRTTLACFDVERGELHRVWRARLRGERADRYLGADPRWEGDELVLVDDEGKTLRRAACPPTPEPEEPAEPPPTSPPG